VLYVYSVTVFGRKGLCRGICHQSRDKWAVSTPF